MNSRINLLLMIAVLRVIVAAHVVVHRRRARACGEVSHRRDRGDGLEPGLHFKLPMVENVASTRARYSLSDHSGGEVPHRREEESSSSDYFVKWRITDPRSTPRPGGEEAMAVERLQAIVKEGIKAAIVSEKSRRSSPLSVRS